MITVIEQVPYPDGNQVGSDYDVTIIGTFTMRTYTKKKALRLPSQQ